jgi:type II secretion system (T2SS) protein G
MSDERPRSSGSNTTLIIILVIIAAICLGCGGLGALMFFGVREIGEMASLQIETVEEMMQLEQAIATGIESKRLRSDVTEDQMGAELLSLGLVTEDKLIDAWGQRYVFRKGASGSWAVVSLGADGVENTADDHMTTRETSPSEAPSPEGR